MIKRDLICCTITSISLLLKVYELGSIDYETFTDNIQIKVAFLKTCIDSIDSAELKDQVTSILEKCQHITACRY